MDGRLRRMEGSRRRRGAVKIRRIECDGMDGGKGWKKYSTEGRTPRAIMGACRDEKGISGRGMRTHDRHSSSPRPILDPWVEDPQVFFPLLSVWGYGWRGIYTERRA